MFYIGDCAEKQRSFAESHLQNMRHEHESLIANKFNAFICVSEQ